MAELLGRATGTCRGLGGSMHIADPGLGIFGANGIVGAGHADRRRRGAGRLQLRGRRRWSCAFFGDGAVAQGAFHEAVNLAALWKLPVVFFCENNGYAEFSPNGRSASGAAGDPGRGATGSSTSRRRQRRRGRRRCHDRRGAADPRRRRARVRRGGHLPLARPLRGRPERYRAKDELSRVAGSAIPLVIARARLLGRGVGARAARRGRDAGARPGSTPRSKRRGGHRSRT